LRLGWERAAESGAVCDHGQEIGQAQAVDLEGIVRLTAQPLNEPLRGKTYGRWYPKRSWRASASTQVPYHCAVVKHLGESFDESANAT
jgi:hypothetical protein